MQRAAKSVGTGDTVFLEDMRDGKPIMRHDNKDIPRRSRVDDLLPADPSNTNPLILPNAIRGKKIGDIVPTCFGHDVKIIHIIKHRPPSPPGD